MSHNYRFGPPSGGKGWPTFGPDGKVVRDQPDAGTPQQEHTPAANDGKWYRLVTLEGKPLAYWDITDPAYGQLEKADEDLIIVLISENDYWYPDVSDLKLLKRKPKGIK